MPRKKRTASTPDTEVSEPNLTSTAAAETSPINPAVDEAPPFEPTRTYHPTAEDKEAARDQSRPRFRSCVTDTHRGYTRLIDNERQRFVVLFEAKPPEDVLTALKGAGFYYQREYEGFQNVWLRRNDFEGRVQVESIEKLLRDLTPGVNSPEVTF